MSSPPSNMLSAAPYTPPAASASERLLGSVLGRFTGALAAPIGRTLHFADRLIGGYVEDAEGRRLGGARSHGLLHQPAARLFPAALYGATATAEADLATNPQPTAAADGSTPPAPATAAPATLKRAAPATPTARAQAAPAQVFAAGPRPPQPRSDLRLPPTLKPNLLMSAPERMWSAPPLDRDPAGLTGDGPAASMTLVSAGWEPKAAATATRAEARGAESSAPLWKALPPPDLAPVIAAVAADLGKATRGQSHPGLTLLQGSDSAAAAGPPASSVASEPAPTAAADRSQLDASTKLLDAVRAHASAHAASSDDRVTLGDLTLIAFADSRKQLAAASAFNAPTAPDIERAMGHLPHPKISHTNHTIRRKIEENAQIVHADLMKLRTAALERSGSYG